MIIINPPSDEYRQCLFEIRHIPFEDCEFYETLTWEQIEEKYEWENLDAEDVTIILMG